MVNKHRDAFLSLCGLTDEADADFVKAVPDLAACEVRFEKFGGRAFDGASRVDVVVRLGRDRAVPFELKLGRTRLNKARIDEWLAPCQPSHDGQRWKGNMMAILDRRFSRHVPDELTVTVEGARITLTRNWFVITRRQHSKRGRLRNRASANMWILELSMTWSTVVVVRTPSTLWFERCLTLTSTASGLMRIEAR